jgi:diaminopimelate epimerase
MTLTRFLSLPVPADIPATRAFIKMQGIRNHFVFVEQRGEVLPLSVEEVVRICDVHVGVGAEQVIGICEPTTEGQRQGAHAFMRILNIDGTEAEACGNATRCMAKLMFEESGRDELIIETLGGLLSCQKASDDLVSVTLGPITMDWPAIPLSERADTAHLPLASGPLTDGLALNIGNPHAVFFVPDFDAIDIPAVAPAIAGHPLFLQSANVGVAEVVDRHTLRLAVWERPGILTEACGTGACVAAYAGVKRGYLAEGPVTVHLPGGTLRIELLPDGRAIKTGPAAICCFGYV